MPYRTLEELRQTLKARLGFAASGATAGVNQAVIDSFLQDAQLQLYWLQDWRRLTFRFDKVMGVGQTLYDYPAVAGGATKDANPERLLRVEVNMTPSGNPSWRKLEEGITTDHRNALVTNSWPQRYDRFSQLEVLPAADQAYTLRVWYIQELDRFTQNGDRATIDDNMIFLHALANGKAHYRHPDAPVYSDQLNVLLANLRGATFGNLRFLPPGKEEPVEPRPVVV